MKKYSVLIMMLSLCIGAAAESFVNNGIKYVTKTNNEVGVTANSYSGSVTIPATVSYNGINYSVTSIESSAFNNCSNLTSVYIGSNVTTIESGAFGNCKSLTYVSIPNSVKSIKGQAFSGCKSLTSISLPSSLTTLSGQAFLDCTGLKSITLPSSLTQIAFGTFSGCTGLTSVTIPSSITSIANNAFYGCKSLTSVTIPKSITSIDQYAFFECTGLTTVYYLATNPVGINSQAFSSNVYSNATLVVAYGKKSTISNLNGWGNFYNIKEQEKPLEIGDEFVVDGIRFCVESSNSVSVIANSYSGSISIPARVTYRSYTFNVTSIGDYAFRYCEGLTSITIPSSVTSIGRIAFYSCTRLTSVNIPTSVINIGASAFYGCTGLTSLNIPNSVTTIGDYAFGGCSKLTSVSIPNSVNSISDWVFYNCAGLTSVNIPTSVINIGVSAFAGCSGLTSINIPNSVKSIGNNAFSGCSRLTSVSIPNSVTNISDGVFSGCTGLTSFNIPNTVTSIGASAFYNCSGITSISIPTSVKSIGSNSFYNCTKLTSVTIPNSVTTIVSDAFSGCSDLTDVYINIVDFANDNIICSNIANKKYHYLYQGTEISGNFSIPNSVKTIGNYALYGCTGLTSVSIGNSITSIGSDAFSGCTGLTDVYINIVSFANDNIICSNIANKKYHYLYQGTEISGTLYIPNSVTKIGSSALSGCSTITTLTIPTVISSIGENAFKNCTGLKTVYYLATNPVGINESAFSSNVYSTATLIVASDKKTAISKLSGWKNFTNIKEQERVLNVGDEFVVNNIRYKITTNSTVGVIANSSKYSDDISIPKMVSYGSYSFNVTSIEGWAFCRCTGLKSISLPNSLKNIGYAAFAYCSNLKTVIIPNSVTRIDEGAFAECGGLTSVSVSNSVTKIDAALFQNCTSLASIKIPSSVQTIGIAAFYSCSSLTTVNIPSSVTRIDTCAFERCSGLTSVTIPNSVKTIRDSVFCNCSNLTSVTISKAVTSVGKDVFAGCEKLTKVTYLAENPIPIGNTTFEQKVYDNATLFVGKGCLAKVWQLSGWKNFKLIMEQNVGKADANNDGNVNTADVVFVYNYIIDGETADITKEMANVNGDNDVNTADVVAIYNVIINGDNSVLPPENVTAKKVDKNVVVTWNARQGATYAVYHSLDGNKYSIKAAGLSENTFTDKSPLEGTNYYVVVCTVNNNTSEFSNPAKIVYKKSAPSGLYLGVMCFNDEVYTQPISLLNTDNKNNIDTFINGITMKKPSILCYTVDQAIDALKDADIPDDLTKVVLVTFTDGLDSGSTMLNYEYDTDKEYLAALKERINNENVGELKIDAYSVGLRGSEITTDAQIADFKSTLSMLASSEESAYETTYIGEMGSQFRQIASSLHNSTLRYTASFGMYGFSKGTRVRFTLDNVTSANNSSKYIEGTYDYETQNGTRTYKLTDVTYYGVASSSGNTVIGTAQGMYVFFSFADIATSDNSLLDKEDFCEWCLDTDSSWKENTDWDIEQLAKLETQKTSAIVMLVLDCSSSLDSQFKMVKNYATAFVETYYESNMKEPNNDLLFDANGISFTMIKVDGGTFKMGKSADGKNEEPVHNVTLSNYYIGQTEVTQALWEAVMNNYPSKFRGDLLLPVETVDWYQCQKFIQKLNQLTGKQFRLPTEAEWEFAAKGGNKSKGYIYSGSNTLSNVAWCHANSGDYTHKVATKSPNELGIYDMSGNVMEWCQDWYGEYSSKDQTNPTGPASGTYRVLRGGCYDYSCDTVSRCCNTPGTTASYSGFRLVLSE